MNLFRLNNLHIFYLFIFIIIVSANLCIHIYCLHRYHTLKTFFYSLVPQIISLVAINGFITDAYISFTSLFVICYPNILFLKKINKNFLQTLNSQMKMSPRIISLSVIKGIKQFLSDHNKFCKFLYDCNRFWSGINLSLVVTLCPIHLMWLHTVLFEPMPIESRWIIGWLGHSLNVRDIFHSTGSRFIQSTNPQNYNQVVSNSMATQRMAV